MTLKVLSNADSSEIETKTFRNNKCYDESSHLCLPGINKSYFTGSTLTIAVPPLPVTKINSLIYADFEVKFQVIIPGVNSGNPIAITDTALFSLSYTIIVKKPIHTLDASKFFRFETRVQLHKTNSATNNFIYLGSNKLGGTSQTILASYQAANYIYGISQFVETMSSGTLATGKFNCTMLTSFGLAVIENDEYTVEKPVPEIHSITSISKNKLWGLRFGMQKITITTLTMTKGNVQIFIDTDIKKDDNENMCHVSSNLATSIICYTSYIHTGLSPTLYNRGVDYFSTTPTDYMMIPSLNIPRNLNVPNGASITLETYIVPKIQGFYKFVLSTNLINLIFRCEFTTSTFTTLFNTLGTSTLEHSITLISSFQNLSTISESTKYFCDLTFTGDNSNEIIEIGMLVCPSTYATTETDCNTKMTNNETTVTDQRGKTMIYEIVFLVSQNGQAAVLSIAGTTKTILTFSSTTTKRENVLEGLIKNYVPFYGKVEVYEKSRDGTNVIFTVILNNMVSAVTLSVVSGTNSIGSVVIIKGFNPILYIKSLGPENLIVPPTTESSILGKEMIVYSDGVQNFWKNGGNTLHIIPDNHFPKVTAIEFDINTKSVKFTVSKVLTDANTYLTSVSQNDAIYEEVFFGSNLVTYGSKCSESGLVHTCDFSSNYQQELKSSIKFFPELVTNYGRIEIDTSLCSSAMGNFTYYPHYGCNCTKFYDSVNWNCVDNCPDELGVDGNNTICRYCPTPFIAYNNTCGFECPIDRYEEVTANGISKFCKKCPPNEVLKNGVCVSSCGQGYGKRNGTDYCELCSDLGMFSSENVCVERCPWEQIKNYFYNEVTDVDEWYCGSCSNSTLLAQDDKCVEQCGPGFEKRKNTTVDFCFECKIEGKFHFNSTCVDKCYDHQTIIHDKNLCINCLSSQVLDNNECNMECPINKQIINKEIVNGTQFLNTTEFRTTCTTCLPNQYLLEESCKTNCVGNRNYTTIRKCVATCPSDTIAINPVNMTLSRFLQENTTNSTLSSNTTSINSVTNISQNLTNSYIPLNFKHCLKCSGSFPVIVNEKCEARCPHGQVANKITKRCEKCTTGSFFNEECVNKCPIKHIDINGICVQCSKSNTPIIFNNTCVASCPIGYYDVLKTIDENFINAVEQVCIPETGNGKDCPEDYCFNGGKCLVSNVTSFTCNCTKGYFGSRCNINKNGLDSMLNSIHSSVSNLEEMFNSLKINNTVLRQTVNKLKYDFTVVGPDNIFVNTTNTLLKLVKRLDSIILSSRYNSGYYIKPTGFIDPLSVVSTNSTSSPTNNANTTTNTNTNSNTNTTSNTNTNNNTTSKNNTSSSNTNGSTSNTTSTNSTTNSTNTTRLLQSTLSNTIDYDIVFSVCDLTLFLNSGKTLRVNEIEVQNTLTRITENTDELLSYIRDINSKVAEYNGIIYMGSTFTLQIKNVGNAYVPPTEISNEIIVESAETLPDNFSSVGVNATKVLTGVDFSLCDFSTTNENYKKLELQTGRMLQNTTSNNSLGSFGDAIAQALASGSLQPPTNSSTSNSTTKNNVQAVLYNADRTQTYVLIESYSPRVFLKMEKEMDPTYNSFSDFVKFRFVHSNRVVDNQIIKYNSTLNTITATCKNGFDIKYPFRSADISIEQYYEAYAKYNISVIDPKSKFFSPCFNYSYSSYADMPFSYRFKDYNSAAFCGNSCKFIGLIENFYVGCNCPKAVDSKQMYRTYFKSYTFSPLSSALSTGAFFNCVGEGFKAMSTNYGFFGVIGITVLSIAAIIKNLVISLAFSGSSSVGQSTGEVANVGNAEKLKDNILNKQLSLITEKIEDEEENTIENIENIEKVKNFKINYADKDKSIQKYEIVPKETTERITEDYNNIELLTLNNSPIKVGGDEDTYKRFNNNLFDHLEVNNNLENNLSNKEKNGNLTLNNFIVHEDRPEKVGDKKEKKSLLNKKKDEKKESETVNKDTRPTSAENKKELDVIETNNEVKGQEGISNYGFFKYLWNEFTLNHLVIRLITCSNPLKNYYSMVASFAVTYSLMFLLNGILYNDKMIELLAIEKTSLLLPSATPVYVLTKEYLRIAMGYAIPLAVVYLINFIMILPKDAYAEFERSNGDSGKIKDIV